MRIALSPARAAAGAWAVVAAAATAVGLLPLAANAATKAQQIERGRYIVKIGGCNDCHTTGYAPSGGKVPEAQWLTGDALGFRGEWGTTYPANLRLYMQNLTADQWVKVARTLQTRPPMPWFALRDMKEADLRAIHAFIRTLQPHGEPAPAYLPPGEMPKGPAVVFPAPPPR